MKVTEKIEILKGDCLELMKSIPDGSIDAIITDPPYGTTACKWDSVIDFKLMWKQLNRIIKPNGAIVLFGNEPFSSALRMSNIKNYKYDWVWVKNNVTGALLAGRQPLRKYENILVFYKQQVVFNEQKIKRTEEEFKISYRKNNTIYGNQDSGIYGEHDARKVRIRPSKEEQMFKSSENVIYFNRDKNRKGKKHPTQKPLALMEYLIKTYTNENETVLDFTMGSGTTGVAAKNLNRKFIGIEQDENYFKIAEKRIKETKQQLTIF
tara:strand:+ start:445 stop:1239 length:795 start_codon:yes stop_codon:yes gene_type:complete